jgi:dihydrofolate reductase
MTLDGVVDAPEWSFDYGFSDGQGETLAAVTDRVNGILLGRNTFEMFAQSWPDRTAEDDPGAPFFNDTMKYVVSGTLSEPEEIWRNSTVVGPYDPEAIRKLKDEVGDLFVSGSTTLVQGLLDDGLIDELHLWVYPLTRPGGPRLFTDDAAPQKMWLAESESYDNGVLYLNLHGHA